MKVSYDHATDILTITLRDGPVDESDEIKPGVILDFDRHGAVIGLEILDASNKVTDPGKILRGRAARRSSGGPGVRQEHRMKTSGASKR